MAELANCPNCGEVFVKAFRPICNNCHGEIEEKFDIVYRFVRKKENRRSSIEEVYSKTGVEKDLIYQFIRDGRLHLSQFPNLGYPCDQCGDMIRQGRLCSKCAGQIKSDLEVSDRDRERKEELRKKHQAYHSLDDRLDRK